MNKNIGLKFGDYIIISELRDNKGILKYKCKCIICGNIIYKTKGDLNRGNFIHSNKICGINYLKNITKDQDYQIIKKSDKKIRAMYCYDLQCKKCGNIITKDSDSIQKYKYNHSSMLCEGNTYTDFIGKIYGDYKIISLKEIKDNVIWFNVECLKCQRVKVMARNNILRNRGTSHATCLNLINSKDIPYFKEFRRRWSGLRYRTTNKNCPKYYNYGGRGIKSDDFKYLIDFYDTMYESFLEHVKVYGVRNTTIERIDVNGDYCLENCKWETMQNQAINKTNTMRFRAIHISGKAIESNSIKRFAEEYGLSEKRISHILYGEVKSNKYNNWEFERL